MVRPLGSDDKARVDAHLEKVVDATKFVGLEGAEAFMLGELRVIGMHVRITVRPDARAERRAAGLVSDLEVPLRSILPAFQGVIPSPIATCSADGTPNVTLVSSVAFVDDERIAFSNQFMVKTIENLEANFSGRRRRGNASNLFGL